MGVPVGSVDRGECHKLTSWARDMPRCHELCSSYLSHAAMRDALSVMRYLSESFEAVDVAVDI